MRIIFFDVDGTLSSPCYNVDGKLQIGMSDEKWAWYCDHYREDAYRWCKPVPQVKDYDFWLAEYYDTPSFYYNYKMWQYSKTGSVDGISGDVDMNISIVDFSGSALG